MRKRALVTGSGVRLGQAIALELARSGYDLALHYHRSADPVLVTQEEGRRLGARTETFQADLACPEEAEGLCRKALEWLGGLDLLVNGSALFYPTPDLQAAWEAWDAFMNLNLRAAFLTVMHCQSALSQSRGSVVNLADIYAERPLKQHLPYCVSKAGLVALTRSLALDLAPSIRVNAVSPGAILLPAGAPPEAAQKLAEKIPLGRLGEPQDIARAVLFLAESPFITGQILGVEGGRLLQ